MIDGNQFHFKSKDNLNGAERKALHDLMHDNDLTIREADKGGSLVVMNTSDYKHALNIMLNNPTLYKPLTSDPTSSHLKAIHKQIRTLEQFKVISPEIHKSILHGEVSCPHFYGLPKIHKPNKQGSILPPFRGIISQIRGPTTRASYWLDSIFKPLVPDFCGNHWVKDNLHVLQKIKTLNEKRQITDNTNILAIDVVDMYNNIPHKEGVEACRFALASLTTYTPCQIREICQLLELVLTLNNFSFNDQHFLQLTGTAMGTPVAPSYANIFMAEFWRKNIAPLPNQPFLVMRYMDDIIALHDGNSQQTHQFLSDINSVHDTIKFTHSNPGKSTAFLDLSIHLLNNNIETDLHLKPTDSKRYLPPSSNHPKHIFRSVVYSGALRLRRICSRDEWFNARITDFRENLLRSGYQNSFITPIINKVCKLRHKDLLSYKLHKPHQKRPFFVTTHHQKLPNVHNIHNQNKDILEKSDKMMKCFPQPPLIALRQPVECRNVVSIRGTGRGTPTTATATGPAVSPPTEDIIQSDSGAESQSIETPSGRLSTESADLKRSLIEYMSGKKGGPS
ncbi:uncharacterized protein LOC106012483, partial [Aplysia californica]|uniref:Uncharacterized protein LOC106012483 n=1 Tax=Aplysia californica TaxID=6500 RepID=A0ABM1A549_APLCA